MIGLYDYRSTPFLSQFHLCAGSVSVGMWLNLSEPRFPHYSAQSTDGTAQLPHGYQTRPCCLKCICLRVWPSVLCYLLGPAQVSPQPMIYSTNQRDRHCKELFLQSACTGFRVSTSLSHTLFFDPHTHTN